MKILFLPVFSRFVSTLGACALLGVSAFAQAPATPSPAATPAKPLESGDQTYVRNTLKSVTYQIQLAKAGSGLTDMNLTRLRDGMTKSLADALVELGKIATAHGEKIPTEVTGTDKVDLDRVTKAKPDKLIKEWSAALAKETKHLDHETELAGKSAQDADLKSFITNYGPGFRSNFTGADAADKAAKKTK